MSSTICINCRRKVSRGICKCYATLPTTERPSNPNALQGGWSRRKHGERIFYRLYKLVPGTCEYATHWLGVDLSCSRDDVAWMLRVARFQLRYNVEHWRD